jgi:hypothetical protein
MTRMYARRRHLSTGSRGRDNTDPSAARVERRQDGRTGRMDRMDRMTTVSEL